MIFLILLAFFISGGFCFGEIFYERDWPRKTLPYLLALLFLTSCAYGQASRYDGTVYTVNQSAPLPGAMLPVLALSGATVQVCSTWNISGCTALAVTYQSSTVSVGNQCPSSAQLYNALATSCSSTADVSGGWGIWAAAGSYAYFVTTAYGTYGPYPFGIDAAGAYVPISGGTNLNFQGTLYANTWQSGGGNNGIAMSLSQCQSLPYACQVIAPALYAQTEAPPWGGFTAALTQATITGPKSSDPLGCVIDNRYATPQLICNEGIGYNSRFNMASWGIVQNALTMGSGNSPHNGALSVMNSQWMGAYDFSTAYGNGSESSVDGLSVLVNSYSPSIGSGIYSNDTHWAPGDVVVENLYAFGVGTTLGQDEGPEARLRIGEPGNLIQVTLSGAPTCGVTCTMSGTQTLGLAGAFGEELPWIDLTTGYSTGYIASFSFSGGVNSVVGSTSTNWDSTFGVSNATTTTTATIGNPTGTNTFPQSNVTAAVASSSGFTTGTAFAFDAGSYKWEGFHITSIPDGTHIVIDSLNYPLLTGSTISQGGLAGYGFKMDADDVCGANGNGISTAGADSAIASGACIKSVYPIISNSAGNNLVLYTGSLPFINGGGPTRGYSSMAGSGGSVTPTVSGGVVTSCTGSGGSGYISSVGPSGYLTNPPQLSYSASPAWTTYPVLALTSVSSGALSGCTVISGGTQGSGGTLSVSVTTSNPYHIYAQAESIQNYNAATGKMDGSALVTMPLAGTFNSGDVIEQEHYFNWKTSGGAMNAVVNSWQHVGQKFARNLILGGIWGTNDYGDQITNTASPSVYYGSPISAPYTLGQGQLGTPYGYFLRGAFRSGLYMTLPPFSQQPRVGAVVVECAPYCSQWNQNYNVLTAGNNNSSGSAEDALQYNPVVQTWEFTAGATASSGFGATQSVIVSPVNFTTSYPAFSIGGGALAYGLLSNYATWSTNQANAVWTASGSPTVTTGVADPWGGTSAVTYSSGSDWVLTNQNASYPVAANTTYKVCVEAIASGSPVMVGLYVASQAATINIGTSWGWYCGTVTTSTGTLTRQFAMNVPFGGTITVAGVGVFLPGQSVGLLATGATPVTTAVMGFSPSLSINGSAMTPSSIAINGGHSFTRHTLLSITLSPSAVAANTCTVQTGITASGVLAGDIVLNAPSAKPTDQAGLQLMNVRVTANNTISMYWCNFTASPITPTAAEIYSLDVEQ